MAGTSSEQFTIEGTVVSGARQGAHFLAIGWVREQLRAKLALEPFAGTLNLKISQQVWDALYSRRHIYVRIAGPPPADCPGFLKRVMLRANGRICRSAWLVIPERTMYQDVLEIIAPQNLRETLGLSDGDIVRVEMFET